MGGVLRRCPPQGSSRIAIFQPRRCAVSTLETGWEGAPGAIGPAVGDVLFVIDSLTLNHVP